MTPIETATAVILVIVGLLLAGAAGLALIRIVRGPSLLDRMIASDMLLTTIILVVGAEMVVGKHARNVPMMLVLAAIAIFATVAVARYVSKQDRPAPNADLPNGAAQDPAEEDAIVGPVETDPGADHAGSTESAPTGSAGSAGSAASAPRDSADHTLETSQGVTAQDTAEESR